MRHSAGRSSQYSFSIVPNALIPRSRFLRNFSHKTTINAGMLYPLYVDEVIPGDTFSVDVSTLCHMTTLLVPIMDNLVLDWHFFFVPYRLVWDHFVNMCGERKNPDDSIDYAAPCIVAPEGGLKSGDMLNYMGLPLGVEWRTSDVHAFEARAYNLIWNEWFRDENLQDSVTVKTDDTNDNASDYVLLPRNKRKDYFTSCLPEPQKGDAVTIPVGTSAPVVGNGLAIGYTDGTNNFGHINVGQNINGSVYRFDRSAAAAYGVDAGAYSSSGSGPSSNVALGLTKDGDKSGLIADLSEVTGASVNALRQAFQLQRLLERDARGGTRFFEILRSQYNVISPDARLQRPEFLGNFSVPVNIHTITQTSASLEGGTAQGTLAGVGVASGVHRGFIKSFVEPGCIIGLASIRSDLSYQQGIPRMFSRRTRFDWYYPALAHLGEQAVLNKEIFVSGTDTDDEAFGYQERWSELKYGVSRISGDLSSTAAQPLDMWHLAQEFETLPTLNSDFVKEDPPLDRCLALTSDVAPQFKLDVLLRISSYRPMPLYDVPGLIDHF